MSNQMIPQTNDTSTAIQLNADSFIEEESSFNNADDSYNHGKWSYDEHQIFLNSILLNGNNWEKINQTISSRSINQIKIYAQKYLNQLIQKYPDWKDKEIKMLFKTKEDIAYLSNI